MAFVESSTANYVPTAVAFCCVLGVLMSEQGRENLGQRSIHSIASLIIPAFGMLMRRRPSNKLTRWVQSTINSNLHFNIG
jgi:hypothetical protein